ncbi:MAG: chemotaxis response regulator protein-glutamate methylesterase [Chloroflexi bacterium]|nr:chemotaxis response regulator protein-glutamate methylesterase [Chloroflexota bacterium]
MIRVLVVDDSAFMRAALTRILDQDPELEVVGTARDGVEALTKVESLQPHVITLDVEMPRMNGLEFLARLMKERPMPVVMLSSLTQEGADTTIEALTLGAVDFVPKPDRTISIHQVAPDLITKIKRAVTAKVSPGPRRRPLRRDGHRSRPRIVATREDWDRVLVIGSSTGGPRALREVFSGLPGDLPAPVLVVQHMPQGFTRSLAEHLNECSELEVREASAGDRLERGVALLAPGGYHMTVRRSGVIRLDQGPTVNGVRPAVDVTLLSAVAAFGARVVAAILTGMGRDGTDGARALKQAGGYVLAEHESTCVVYGMPKSIITEGLADEVAVIEEMAQAIVRYLEKPIRERKDDRARLSARVS